MKLDPYNTIFTPNSTRTWPPLLNLKQTAQILNVSIWTLRKWDNEKKFKAIRIGSGNHRRYKKEDVIKAMNEGI
jgi:excisionase family DNA binding protein